MRILLTGLAMLALVAGVSPRGSVSGADEPITLVFLTWKSSGSGGWNRLLKEFHEKNPRIRIKTQVAPHSSTQYHAIITQRLKNQDPSVDVFLMDVVWPPEFGNAGWAMDLTSRFPPREQAKFIKGPIRANTWQGRIYGIPCYLGAGLFYYRKDLLDKYHFDVPRTWDEMLTQGEAIIKGENDPELYAYSGQFKQYEGLVCDMLEFLWSNGGAVMDSETGRVVLDKNAAIGAVAFVRDKIIGKAAPRGAVNYEEPESLGLFVQGKAVFHRNWPYAWAVANNPRQIQDCRTGWSGRPARLPGTSFRLGPWRVAVRHQSLQPSSRGSLAIHTFHVLLPKPENPGPGSRIGPHPKKCLSGP